MRHQTVILYRGPPPSFLRRRHNPIARTSLRHPIGTDHKTVIYLSFHHAFLVLQLRQHISPLSAQCRPPDVNFSYRQKKIAIMYTGCSRQEVSCFAASLPLYISVFWICNFVHMKLPLPEILTPHFLIYIVISWNFNSLYICACHQGGSQQFKASLWVKIWVSWKNGIKFDRVLAIIKPRLYLQLTPAYTTKQNLTSIYVEIELYHDSWLAAAEVFPVSTFLPVRNYLIIGLIVIRCL
jgi:hypothetical protein